MVVFAIFLFLVAACTPQSGQTADVQINEQEQRETPPTPTREPNAASEIRQEVPEVGSTVHEQEKMPAPEIQQEIFEKGGTLQEWKETIQKATAPDSEESTTTAECESLMKKKIEECSQHQGWSVNNAMEITDFTTDKHYEFQDVKRQDCPGASPDKTPSTIHAETAFLDAQTDNKRASSYQVVCTIGCNWWDCETDLTGVWEGSYSETSASIYCKLKEAGSKTFRITRSGNSFTGTAEYSGVYTVTGGENCEGGTSSNDGPVSGVISGNQISGTIVYSGTQVPFTATIEGNTLTGTYSYTTTAYGPRMSGTGEFTLQKQ